MQHLIKLQGGPGHERLSYPPPEHVINPLAPIYVPASGWRYPAKCRSVAKYEYAGTTACKMAVFEYVGLTTEVTYEAAGGRDLPDPTVPGTGEDNENGAPL